MIDSYNTQKFCLCNLNIMNYYLAEHAILRCLFIFNHVGHNITTHNAIISFILGWFFIQTIVTMLFKQECKKFPELCDLCMFHTEEEKCISQRNSPVTLIFNISSKLFGLFCSTLQSLSQYQARRLPFWLLGATSGFRLWEAPKAKFF